MRLVELPYINLNKTVVSAGYTPREHQRNERNDEDALYLFMQQTFLLAIFLFLGQLLYGQQPNYIYIEADKGQVFYVKINGKVTSSSSEGYIILPSLTDDTYTISIGFPKNIFPEQQLSVVLNKKDQGYQLKNFGEKGWGLFNLQTLEVVMNTNTITSNENEVKKTDAFSTLLSKVVNDPAVLIENKKPVEVVKEDPAPKTGVAIIKTPETIQNPLGTTPETKSSTIYKLSEQRLEKMYEATYIDRINGVSDTIKITYPIDVQIVTLPPATPITDVKEPENKAVAIINSDCKNFANDQDVDKLRVQLLKKGDIDDKLTVAKKYFRTKCFTVKQVKALAELFDQDEAKYRLFDIAYPFISDTENFYRLEEELKDEYYKNRFKAMIKK